MSRQLVTALRTDAANMRAHDEALQADDPCRWGGVDTVFWALHAENAADRLERLQDVLDRLAELEAS